jgi:hypothetical protein
MKFERIAKNQAKSISLYRYFWMLSPLNSLIKYTGKRAALLGRTATPKSFLID